MAPVTEIEPHRFHDSCAVRRNFESLCGKTGLNAEIRFLTAEFTCFNATDQSCGFSMINAQQHSNTMVLPLLLGNLNTGRDTGAMLSPKNDSLHRCQQNIQLGGSRRGQVEYEKKIKKWLHSATL